MTGIFTCHCGNTGVERTPNKSQHTKLTLEKKIVPPLLPGFELATFRSRVRRSNQQAIPAPELDLNVLQTPQGHLGSNEHRHRSIHLQNFSGFVVVGFLSILESHDKFNLNTNKNKTREMPQQARKATPPNQATENK